MWWTFEKEKKQKALYNYKDDSSSLSIVEMINQEILFN